MKAIILVSSIFFLLGLKISSILDLPGKARAAVEINITEKIKQSTPVKSLQMFKESETEKQEKERPDAAEDSAEEELKSEG